jgi:hypothetical protein
LQQKQRKWDAKELQNCFLQRESTSAGMKGTRKEWESPPGQTEHGCTGKIKDARLKINKKIKMSSAEGKAAETAAEVAAEGRQQKRRWKQRKRQTKQTAAATTGEMEDGRWKWRRSV